MALLDPELFLPQDLPRAGVDGAEVAEAADLVDAVADEDGGAGEGADGVAPFLEVLRGEDLRGLRGGRPRAGGDGEGGHAADVAGVEVFALVRDDDGVLILHDGGVDAAFGAGFGHGGAPEGFAGAGIEGEQGGIAAGGVEDAAAFVEAEPGMAEGIVLGPVAGGAGPDELAGLFVEGVKAVASGAVRAPGGGDAAGDDEFFVDEGGGGAVVREGEAAEFLHEGALPDELAGGGVAGEEALAALGVNVAGFAIDGGAGGGVAQVDDVAKEVVGELLPEELAGFGVEAGDALLEVGTFALVAHDVELAASDDGGALAGEVGGPEGGLGVHFGGQAFFQRHAGLERPAPVEPAADAGWGLGFLGCAGLGGLSLWRGVGGHGGEEEGEGEGGDEGEFHGRLAVAPK